MTSARLDFELDGLNCAACVGRAEKALSAVSGVQEAQVNLATRSARVSGDGLSAPALNSALRAAGYPAVPHSFRLAIEGMTCASCVQRVETALAAARGVLSAQVNLADGTARITSLTNSAEAAITAIAKSGYSASVIDGTARRDDTTDRDTQQALIRFLIAAALTLPIFVVEMGGHVFPSIHHFIAQVLGVQDTWILQFLLATVVLAWPGRGFFLKGIPALLRGAPDMNALVALGSGAAWLFSSVATWRPQWLPDGTVAVYFEAAAVIVTLILLGRWLEARAKGRTGAAIRGLIGLRPETARVEVDGDIVERAIEDVTRGDRLHLRPGDRIPVDGIVREGSSFVDESMITGEPLAVEKTKGSALVAGTLNGNGALVMRATAVGGDTMLARIIAMVEEAQGARLPVQNLVNKITAWFVPAVMAVAAVTILCWLVFGPAPALPFALVAGVSVLIIACPCAMGLATPMSIMVGTGRAAELGVLFRQGDALQAIQGVTLVAFDKTGTLTKGQPELVQIIADRPEDEVLSLVAAIEAVSEHPLAGAIVEAAKSRGLELPGASGVAAIPGHGLQGEVNGHRIAVGNAAMMESIGAPVAGMSSDSDRLAQQGQTPVLVAIDGAVVAVLGIADTLKEGAAAAIAGLHARGLKTVMISGDVAPAAEAIARKLGIDQVVAGVLPGGKADAVRALQADGHRVAFVGDGINDAPALAAADVGIAMGTGTDVAVESADIVLVSGNPAGVVNAFEISRRTMTNIRQNLGWAFGYNVLLIPVAAGVLTLLGGPMLSPQLAAGAMALSSVLVVTNALRLRRVKAEIST